MLQIAALGSGSRGNAFVVRAQGTTILVDCGFSAQETTRRLQLIDCDPHQLSAIFVTHEHQDHSGGVGVVSRRYALPVWATGGTSRQSRWGAVAQFNRVSAGSVVQVGALTIESFQLVHDASEPVQFIVGHGDRRIGILTDTGTLNAEAMQMAHRCDGLVLEANHDAGMLRDGPYPPSLKRRVGGQYGHLSNSQARAVLASLTPGRLQWIAAAHLSEQNNKPELVVDQLKPQSERLGARLVVAHQERGLAWQTVK